MILVEDSDPGGPSSAAVRMVCLSVLILRTLCGTRKHYFVDSFQRGCF